jgi:HlyD family secretion protein
MKNRRLWIFILMAAAGLAAIISFLRPEPVAVERGSVKCGPMRVTVAVEGRTRVRDRFIVSAPITGRLGRIVLKEGDVIKRGSLIARIDPPPLDTRTTRQNQAAFEAAQAELRATEAILRQARAALEQATRNLKRAEELSQKDVISRQKLEEAQLEYSSARQNHESAEFEVRAAASNAESIRAGLATTTPVNVIAPVAGHVLRVAEESEKVVDAGQTLVEIADPARLELVFDVLSSDAVKIRPGAEVDIENWGGEQTLRGRVRRVEPSAFTKISALGIEEQRVHVIADITDTTTTLGDGYRVEGRIVIWESPEAVRVPVSALFKSNETWNVFVVSDDRAVERSVVIGHRNDTAAEVLSGLVEGEAVVLYPSDKLQNGSAVE